MSFQVIREGSLEYLRSDLLSGVRHGFSTRYGGVSQGSLFSLNLGLNRGDAPENVRKNYEIFCAAIGADPEKLVFARQTHSDIVETVGPDACGEGLQREIPRVRDGLITMERGVGLVVFSADCAPILLYDPVRCAVGAVHSGWRGTAQGIAEKAVRRMQATFGCRPEDLHAAIGPCIGPCCFETDADVPEAMRAALGAAAEPAITRRGEKYHVDNKLLCRIWLERAGLCPANIDISPDCTACQPERFWSYRRAGAQRGSLASIILLP